MNNDSLLKYLAECRQSGIGYREKFRSTWIECEKQLRCVPPDNWALKEDWQSKIYIPLQAKKSEIAKSYLKKMIFGKRRFFDITGIEGEDKEEAMPLLELIETLLYKGGFGIQNGFVLQEGVDLGTGFIKILMKSEGKGIDLIWRSIFNCVFDPATGQNLEESRFFIDLYRRDLRYVIETAKKEPFKYNKKVVAQFLKDAETEAQEMQTTENNKESFMVVKSIDGTQDLIIPEKYKTVDVDEYWVKVPNDNGDYENRRIVVLNGKYILSNDENAFGFLPFQWLRIKPKKYDSYGKGYIENTRGLQDLMNSCINLGFDSLKISSMDIIVLDDTKVRDSTSIKYKPLAVWKMKDINGVKIQRQPISAISDILKGATLIDQIDQDASGVTRQAQGAPNLSGSGAQSETLGEYQLKLQMINQRFLDIGRFIEIDYVIPLIKKIYKIITNPKLFTQNDVNKILGTKEVDEIEIIDGVAQVTGRVKVPKLELTKLRDKNIMDNFKTVGVTQFTGRLELLDKIKTALEMALSNPTLTALTKIDKLWKKLWQTAEVEDYNDFLRTPEEAKDLLGMGQGQQGQPQGMLQGMTQGQGGI